MVLPELQPKSFKHTFCNVELQFRKVCVKDSEYLDIIEKESREKGESDIVLAYKEIAHFMYGYDESFEERVNFLQNIPLENISDVGEEMSSILSKIGLKRKETTKNPKKVVE